MKIDNQDIYEQIGNLFYSIAVAQQLRALDVAGLKLLISKDWFSSSRDVGQKVSDETHHITVAIDSLQGSRIPPMDAYNKFSKFYSDHPEVFTADIKQRMLNTAAAITETFKSVDTEENVHYKDLKNLLNQRSVETV